MAMVEFHSIDTLLVYSWGTMMGQSGGSLKRGLVAGMLPQIMCLEEYLGTNVEVD